MKKIEKQISPFVMDLFMMVKSTFKHFGFIKPTSGRWQEHRWMFFLLKISWFLLK